MVTPTNRSVADFNAASSSMVPVRPESLAAGATGAKVESVITVVIHMGNLKRSFNQGRDKHNNEFMVNGLRVDEIPALVLDVPLEIPGHIHDAPVEIPALVLDMPI